MEEPLSSRPPITVDDRHQLTKLLREWKSGDSRALSRLMDLVHNELARIARGYLAKERHMHSWQPTMLVNEAFLRLVDCRQLDWQDRAHLFRLAAKIMREIVIDYARKKRSSKHGGSVEVVAIDDAKPPLGKTPNVVDLMLLNTALDKLEVLDPRKAQIVEMKFFAGLSIGEIAESLGLAESTVHLDLRLARIWLFQAMQNGKIDEP
jgi:RNA polymerase sigma-70 factor, ECF subfamily